MLMNQILIYEKSFHHFLENLDLVTSVSIFIFAIETSSV
jgi:hypothetical protein